jgi:hypothetical protein
VGAVFLGAVLQAFFGPSARGAGVLVRELTALRDALPAADPQRGELNFRIADLLAQTCLSAAAPQASAESLAERQADCRESARLYAAELPSAPAALQPRVRYQLARLALERRDLASARSLFEAVHSVASEIELRRESAFRLAEIAETEKGAGADAVQRWYRAALALCAGTDACSFARYRIAWALRNAGKLPEAIDEMRVAILDSRGQIRPEAVRDLVQFMGQEPARATKYLSEIEEISARHSLPGLLEELGLAYLTGGSKAEGTQVLELVQARQPTTARAIRLLEELLGLRQAERFEKQLVYLEKVASETRGSGQKTSGPAPSTGADELQSACRRIAVQLDGERASRPEKTSDYIRFSIAALTLFPALPDRLALMEGVVAALESPTAKLERLALWLRDPGLRLAATEKLVLGELRLGIAQKAKEHGVVVEEADALLGLSPLPEKRRGYAYARAKALADLGQQDSALVAFVALADEALRPGAAAPDTLAIQAQNLALDLLNQKKDYDALIARARSWTESPALRSLGEVSSRSVGGTTSLARELADMAAVAEQAAFEKAVALGTHPDALQIFVTSCLGRKLLPQSCENAKVLATRLGRHSELVSVLRSTGERAALIQELETGGEFAEAARLLEHGAKTPLATAEILRISLLYELGGNNAERDRVLRGLFSSVAQAKVPLPTPEQRAILATAWDAGALDGRWLRLRAFDAGSSAWIAERLGASGSEAATLEARKALLAEPSSTGPSWDQVVWSETLRLQAVESAIGFHGRDGQRKFQLRIAALRTLSEHVDRYLPGSPVPLRVRLLRVIENCHARLASAIHESPVPPTLDAEQRAQVLASLAEMAKPFEERALALRGMLEAELAAAGPAASSGAGLSPLAELARAEIRTLLEGSVLGSVTSGATQSAGIGTQVGADELKPHLEKLAAAPAPEDSLRSLQELRALYERRGNPRLVAYYAGRISALAKSLEGGERQP